MKAATRERYGSVDVVEVREIEQPSPVEDQVLVRVRAASVNRADLDGLKPRPQFIRLFMGIRVPRQHRLGADVAGEVEVVGPGVTRFKPGDRVFADMFSFGAGSFAEYVCAPERAFLPIPSGLTFEDAATLPHSAVLAVQGLRLRNGRTIKAGDRVLIDGASGNVGPFAVQVAKALGAEVTGVASPEKLEFVRSLGADHVIDYRTTDYTKAGKRYDWIVDTDSHHSLFAVRRALVPGGVYVTLGGTSWPILVSLLVAPFLSRAAGKRMGLLLWWKPFNPPDVGRVTGLIAAGRVRPAIDRRYPLDQVVDALRWVDEGHARGKVLVVP
jgi:NADPH:quinone reductase-like Zn-dependent oxidoreductase